MVKKRIKPPADLKFGGMQADLIIIDELSDVNPTTWVKLKERDQRGRIDTDSPIRGSW